MRRSQRIAAITKRLIERPHHVFSLNGFAEEYGAAKSTISEDLTLIRQTFQELSSGKVETISGAAGGVRYVPCMSGRELFKRVDALCDKLAEPKRILPGGFIYLNDLAASPSALAEIGEIFAVKFGPLVPEYVVTIETAGIPIALMTARSLNIPLVVARRSSRPTEGSVLTVNYESGSSRRLETMSLSRRDLPAGATVLLMDDFMRAGGTLRGLANLMNEFDCPVVGKAVLIETLEPSRKHVQGCISLIQVEEVDEEHRSLRVKPSVWIEEKRDVDELV